VPHAGTGRGRRVIHDPTQCRRQPRRGERQEHAGQAHHRLGAPDVGIDQDRAINDEVLVRHQGRVVERGETSQVLGHPRDQYTIRLLEAIPNPCGRPGNHITR